MPFKKDSLAVTLDRVYANYTSLYRPLDKTPRHNLLKVFSSVDAGMYHQLLGDLDFLSLQIFPDTAEGDYLREHWSSRTTPLYAIAANGNVIVSGKPQKPIPAGMVLAAASGERYYTEQSYRVGVDGVVTVYVKAQDTGTKTNLAAGEELSIVSAIPAGIDSKAVVDADGITGGADAETDEEYLVRVLTQLRNPARYGKKDDFASWAVDASPEVNAAWEYKNFGVFGALLVQVIGGSQMSGVYQVANIQEVTNYINEVAPPIMFTVKTPEIINLNPTLSLLSREDTQGNRDTAINRIKSYLQLAAMPGVQITAGALRLAVIDGVTISDATVKLNGDTTGIVTTTIMQYPYIGEASWE